MRRFRSLLCPALALVLAVVPLARASAADLPPVHSEVVVSLWAFVTPGMNEKRGCRIRVVIENLTAEPFGFYAKYRALVKEEEKDAWFVSAANIPTMGRTERLYSCVQLPDRIELDTASDLGYPRTCEVSGERSSPCPLKIRFESNVKLGGP
jgi:hypothetical protein